jgi:hypothetical protein
MHKEKCVLVRCVCVCVLRVRVHVCFACAFVFCVCVCVLRVCVFCVCFVCVCVCVLRACVYCVCVLCVCAYVRALVCVWNTFLLIYFFFDLFKVLKMKPPMTFSIADCDRVAKELDDIIGKFKEVKSAL